MKWTHSFEQHPKEPIEHAYGGIRVRIEGESGVGIEFGQQATKLGLYKEKIINLDFHTAPHYGDESVLEKHWAGARGKVMKGAICLFVQDADSKLMLYTAADIQRSEADDQVMSFLSFWQGIQRGVQPTLIFYERK